MQNNDFDIKTLINYVEKEYRIEREDIFNIIELSMIKAASKNKMFSSDLYVEIDRNDYSIHIFDKFIVDDELSGPGIMSSKDVKKYSTLTDFKEGDIVTIEFKPEQLGRICARDSRMMILQKIKQTKTQNIMEEFQNKIGTIVEGIITGFDKGNIIFTVNGNIDMVIPKNEKIYNERYKTGDSISGVIIDINKKQKYSPIVVSRSSDLFIEELIRREVPELSDNSIEIIKIVRIPGFKSKIVVKSNNPKLEPIGTCVGRNGLRIKNIINEFQNEKIDIVKYSDNTNELIKESLTPYTVLDMKTDYDLENNKIITVSVKPEDYHQIIGRYGKNIALVSKLVDCKITIEKSMDNASFEERKTKAIETISDILDISMIEATAIVNSGYLTIDDIASEELDMFISSCGLGEITAAGVHAASVAVVKHLTEIENNNVI